MHIDLKTKLVTMAMAALGIGACGAAKPAPGETGGSSAVPTASESTQGDERASESRCSGQGNCCAEHNCGAEHTCCSHGGKVHATDAPADTRGTPEADTAK